jgi:hypothetical protein
MNGLTINNNVADWYENSQRLPECHALYKKPENG